MLLTGPSPSSFPPNPRLGSIGSCFWIVPIKKVLKEQPKIQTVFTNVLKI